MDHATYGRPADSLKLLERRLRFRHGCAPEPLLAGVLHSSFSPAQLVYQIVALVLLRERLLLERCIWRVCVNSFRHLKIESAQRPLPNSSSYHRRSLSIRGWMDRHHSRPRPLGSGEVRHRPQVP